MRVLLTDRFQSERAYYRLAFTCEDCVYYAEHTGRCTHGYPNEIHRARAFEPGGTLDGMFCKEFEIA